MKTTSVFFTTWAKVSPRHSCAFPRRDTGNAKSGEIGVLVQIIFIPAGSRRLASDCHGGLSDVRRHPFRQNPTLGLLFSARTEHKDLRRRLRFVHCPRLPPSPTMPLVDCPLCLLCTLLFFKLAFATFQQVHVGSQFINMFATLKPRVIVLKCWCDCLVDHSY